MSARPTGEIALYTRDTPADELREAFLELKRKQGCTEEEAAATVESSLEQARDDGGHMDEILRLLNAGAGGLKGRGFTLFSQSTIASQNFLMMWGCGPSRQVALETAMITNITDTLKNRFDRDTLTIQLPQAFDHLKGEDALFEMVTSNTI